MCIHTYGDPTKPRATKARRQKRAHKSAYVNCSPSKARSLIEKHSTASPITRDQLNDLL